MHIADMNLNILGANGIVGAAMPLSTGAGLAAKLQGKGQVVVAVFGAGGGLGIHMLMLAKSAHTRVIAVETKPEKFAACRKAGADEVIDGTRNDVPEALMDLNAGGIDVAIDFVSSRQTLEHAAAALGPGGRLITLGGSGQPFLANPKLMLEKELELLGSRYATKQEVIEALELVARGDVWPLVTDVRPMTEAEALHDDVLQLAI